jgi:hypothetical protein
MLAFKASLRVLRCALLGGEAASSQGSEQDSAAGLVGLLQEALFGDSAPTAEGASQGGAGTVSAVVTEDGTAQVVRQAARQAQLQADLAQAKRRIASAQAGHRHIPNVDEFMALAQRVASSLQEEEADKARSNRQRVANLVAQSSALQAGLLTHEGTEGQLPQEYTCLATLGLTSQDEVNSATVLAAARSQLSAFTAGVRLHQLEDEEEVA